MPKRKAKECVKLTEEDKNNDKRIRREEKKEDFVDEEVERQIAAIRAIRDVEIEQTLTALRLLRSNFTEEQLDTPVLDFFKENLPDLSISRNEETGEIELKWKDESGDSLAGNANGADMNYSILKRLSMSFPDLYSRSSLGGYDLPDNVNANLLGTDNPQLDNLVFQGTSENQMLASHDAFQTPGILVAVKANLLATDNPQLDNLVFQGTSENHDAFQTPGVNGQRISFGTTPKTRRLPKPGEMMLSVHGSPLGVYNEDYNMGAINEENS